MMRKECSMEEARFKAEAFCSASEHCRADVLSKLYQWGAPEESWEGILNHLEKERYITYFKIGGDAGFVGTEEEEMYRYFGDALTAAQSYGA